VENINSTLKGVKNALAKLDEFKFYLNFEGERLTGTGETKGYFKVKIQPKPDKFYLLGLASSENGRATERVTTWSGQSPYGSTGTGGTYVETKRTKNSITFIAQYAQRFLNAVDMRLGIMESEFGFGADIYPLAYYKTPYSDKYKDKIMISFDAYDFNTYGKDAHLKVKGQYNLTKNLYVNLGYDDFLNKGYRSAIIGGGLIFLDEDIKYLLGRVPVPVSQ